MGQRPDGYRCILVGDMTLQADYDTPVFCQHANECPHVCPCKSDCWCQKPGRMCAEQLMERTVKRTQQELETGIERFVPTWLRESNLIEGVDDPEADFAALEAWEHLKEEPKLTLGAIRFAHWLLLMELDPRIAGRWREWSVTVGGRNCPNFPLVPNLMKEWLKQHEEVLTEDAIRHAHVAFERIHPFADGNGRIGRMVLNYQRVQAGLPELCILNAEKQSYYAWFR